jgi:hypothetical protein
MATGLSPRGCDTAKKMEKVWMELLFLRKPSSVRGGAGCKIGGWVHVLRVAACRLKKEPEMGKVDKNLI